MQFEPTTQSRELRMVALTQNQNMQNPRSTKKNCTYDITHTHSRNTRSTKAETILITSVCHIAHRNYAALRHPNQRYRRRWPLPVRKTPRWESNMTTQWAAQKGAATSQTPKETLKETTRAEPVAVVQTDNPQRGRCPHRGTDHHQKVGPLSIHARDMHAAPRRANPKCRCQSHPGTRHSESTRICQLDTRRGVEIDGSRECSTAGRLLNRIQARHLRKIPDARSCTPPFAQIALPLQTDSQAHTHSQYHCKTHMMAQARYSDVPHGVYQSESHQ
jgi:hypothetical protein